MMDLAGLLTTPLTSTSSLTLAKKWLLAKLTQTTQQSKYYPDLFTRGESELVLNSA